MAAPVLDPAILVGTWKIDLRATPDAEPYYQTFSIESIDGKSFSGRFYGTPFDAGLVNTDWGYVHFAFSTADGQTPYHHSGKLVDGTLQGMTYAPGRDFLAVWTAEKVTE